MAEADHAVITDSADVSTRSQLQAGIDSLPAGTRYCLTTTPTSTDTYEVPIRDQWPSKGPELLATMTFTTTALPDGSHRISAIRPA
ncbi:hypothetical protein [Nocardia thailandica]|uniref:hypothetical protein n=1 Tax=Nocardia thailandica TaxID=257275 RepID=UPI0002F0DC75|nr:hypothetical protein [Nocardia thailandica]